MGLGSPEAPPQAGADAGAAAPKAAERFPLIDSARGIAAMSVLVRHATLLFSVGTGASYLTQRVAGPSISYGTYLWHYSLHYLWGTFQRRDVWFTFGGISLVTIAVASPSYFLSEPPAQRYLRSRSRRRPDAPVAASLNV
jgi:peptidoglycan/LPS O-acetylase OafA/YrhL